MSTESNAPEPVGEEAMQILDEALTQYQRALNRDATAIGYLRSRGFDREDVTNFRLGIVSDPLPGHHRFEGMLVIPYLWRDDRPLTMRFRCIQDHQHVGHGKYNSITGDPGRIFNVRALHDAESVIHLCEGELDAIILNKVGLQAVGMPGATTWRPRHRRALAGFSRIHVWGDPDDAGSAFVMKVTNALKQAHAVPIKGGDVNEVFLKEGAAGLLRLVR